MNTATATRQPTLPQGRPVDLTCREQRGLNWLIAALRSGRINDVAVQHLEVDGVLQLDPLIQLAGGHPSAN